MLVYHDTKKVANTRKSLTGCLRNNNKLKWKTIAITPKTGPCRSNDVRKENEHFARLKSKANNNSAMVIHSLENSRDRAAYANHWSITIGELAGKNNLPHDMHAHARSDLLFL